MSEISNAPQSDIGNDHCLSIADQGSKYPNMRYVIRNMVTIPGIATSEYHIFVHFEPLEEVPYLPPGPCRSSYCTWRAAWPKTTGQQSSPLLRQSRSPKLPAAGLPSRFLYLPPTLQSLSKELLRWRRAAAAASSC